MRIEIETDNDIHECETCGASYASGGVVTVDGVEVINLPAQAHCYGGQSFNEDELLVLALKKLGHVVIVDGDDYHVSCQIEDN